MEYKEIILAKICSILSKKSFIIKKHGELKKILKCCGLHDLYDKNEYYLEPYRYNHKNGYTYENDNIEYNLFVGLDNIFSELYKNNNIEKLMKLLAEIGENLNPYLLQLIYQDDKYEKYFAELNNLYQTLGLSISTENDNITINHLCQSSEYRIKDIFAVEEWLYENYLEVYKSYEGAISAYKNSNYGTCIEACRTTLTGLFSKFKGTEGFAKWIRGAGNISGEIDEDTIRDLKTNIDRTSIKDLADFFGENTSGNLKKTRAIYTIYSMMSDYGTHRQENQIEEPTSEDALMMLRMMEDIVIWVFMKVNK